MHKTLTLLALMVTSLVLARPYKYYLDPQNAEKVLGSLSLRPRLADEEWLRLINFDKNEKRVIRSGDNLWNISRIRFKDPFLWRKLWQENPWLTNPHELEIGRMLAYYREDSSGNSIKQIPIVKLRPERTGTVSDIDNDIVVNRVLKSRYRIGFLVLTGEEYLGELTGAYSDKEGIGSHDAVYASLNEDLKAQPGTDLAVVRQVQQLRDKTQSGAPVVGDLVRIVGEARVLGSEENLTRVQLTHEFYPVNRGDRLIPIPIVTRRTLAEFPSRDLIPQIIMGEDLERIFIRQGELVVLNKGSENGMKEGFLFKVFEDTDPLNNSRNGVTPNSKGEVSIVYLGSNYSVGIVNRNQEPLKIGDSLLSFPELPDRPTAPKRVRQEVSID
ncbi:MAG: hypothetical protein FJ112_06745 [Deltaproteobacteria bacterium]|nr:hypothetical protein [Deltaproteobacteria bacterium]